MTVKPPSPLQHGLEHGLEHGLGEARRYWEERASCATTDCERVEQSQRTQRMRFEVFVRGHAPQGRSLLDVGCGTGDLFEHLQRHGIACEYTGIDISDAMIERARVRFPAGRFVVGHSLDGLPSQFDYTVSIGIHNIKVADAWELLSASMRRQFDMCRIAAHLSLLTDRYGGFASHIQAWKVEDVLALALSITPHVVLRTDYLPNDFSITLYRAPLIDTDPSLMLD
jgi:SAM-dependent methyltransferase